VEFCDELAKRWLRTKYLWGDIALLFFWKKKIKIKIYHFLLFNQCLLHTQCPTLRIIKRGRKNSIGMDQSPREGVMDTMGGQCFSNWNMGTACIKLP
jgi:hypothetical protein